MKLLMPEMTPLKGFANGFLRVIHTTVVQVAKNGSNSGKTIESMIIKAPWRIICMALKVVAMMDSVMMLRAAITEVTILMLRVVATKCSRTTLKCVPSERNFSVNLANPPSTLRSVM